MPEMSTAHQTIVWDCFMFNNEFPMLDFRLKLLDQVVDHFVLIESTRTHAGQPKRAWFAENAERYAPYRSKIRHVLVDDMPVHASSTWVRERFQRAAVWRGLSGVSPGDLVMVGDLDEVPDPAVVRELARTLRRPTRLAMRHFVFAANFEVPVTWTDGTMAVRGDQLSAPQIAVLMGDPDAQWSPENDHLLPAAGCHVSFMGGRDAVADKLRAFAHQEFSVPALGGQHHIDRCLALGVHIAGAYAIARRRREQLPAMLRLLEEMHPDLFDFRPGPPRLVALVYLAYTRLRPRMPLRLLSVIDAHPVTFGLVFGPPLLIFDAAKQTAMRYRLRARARRVMTAARSTVVRIDSTGG
jgi:beta-1,4-mannosyl-glycoprotein beta-1,4-N-acetylglucosaminyltransferase